MRAQACLCATASPLKGETRKVRESAQYHLLVSRAVTQRLDATQLDSRPEAEAARCSDGEEAEDAWVREDRIKAREGVRRMLVDMGVSWGEWCSPSILVIPLMGSCVLDYMADVMLYSRRVQGRCG
jgi:hypothetical protein